MTETPTFKLDTDTRKQIAFGPYEGRAGVALRDGRLEAAFVGDAHRLKLNGLKPGIVGTVGTEPHIVLEIVQGDPAKMMVKLTLEPVAPVPTE